jgi:hypothetical protein
MYFAVIASKTGAIQTPSPLSWELGREGKGGVRRGSPPGGVTVLEKTAYHSQKQKGPAQVPSKIVRNVSSIRAGPRNIQTGC